VRHRVPVEGQSSDPDGMPIHFLLHVVDGRLSEIEVFREDGRQIVNLPSATEIEVSANA
jgi:hypothetical protein